MVAIRLCVCSFNMMKGPAKSEFFSCEVGGRRSATVQTGVDAGTNPIHRKTFVVGMRGGAVPVPPRPSDSEAVASAKREATKEATRTRVKTVTLEYVP